MPIYNIPIYGIIGSPEDKNDKTIYFTLENLLMHLSKAKGFDAINLNFSSDGGICDIADQMMSVTSEFAKNNKSIITSSNSGNVCSAASKFFMLPESKELRKFNPSKGVFLIHNPWTKIEGDAAYLAEASRQIKSTEDDYAKFYAQKTGNDISIIRAFMGQNVPLTTEQIDTLGFATIVNEPVKAIAKLNFQNKNMDDKKLEELNKNMGVFNELITKALKFFKPKALMLTSADGNELEFPDITDASEIKAGVKVVIKGKPATGEFLQPDGSTIVCKDGLVVEVKTSNPDMQALKDENSKLKAELDELKKTSAEMAKNNEEGAKALVEIKAQYGELLKKFPEITIKGAKTEKQETEAIKRKEQNKKDLEKYL